MNRELASEFSMDELQEFLEGDIRPPAADPAFKERLREDLWQMLQARQTPKPDDQVD